jgi:hypothetical protein
MPSLSSIIDTDHAILALSDWLLAQDYARRNRDGIVTHVRTHGELSGTVPALLDAADLATATDVFVEALPAVPQSSREWDIDGHWTPTADDLPEPPEAGGNWRYPGVTLPPIRGGSPDPEEFIPTAAEIADYESSLADVDLPARADQLGAFHCAGLNSRSMMTHSPGSSAP